MREYVIIGMKMQLITYTCTYSIVFGAYKIIT
jgi:hypothetical protein